MKPIEDIKETAERIAKSLIDNMRKREGYKDVWEATDRDVRRVLRDTWITLAKDELMIQQFPLHHTYSSMEDIHHADAEWIRLHWIRNEKACFTRIKGDNLTDDSFECDAAELYARAVADALPKEREEEIKNFVLYDCFEDGLDSDETAKKAIEKFTVFEVRAWLEGGMTPIQIEKCKSIEEWIEQGMWKCHDLYWENHPMNQD